MTRYVAPERDVDLQGHYAGAVSRLLAWVIDAFVLSLVFSVMLSLIKLAVEVVTGRVFEPADYGYLTVAAFTVWSIAYFAVPWTMSGKTVGMATLGIEVRLADGNAVDGRRAVVRILVLPLSFLLLGLGLLVGLVQRERRCLHDLISGTCVVYSWDARRARLRLLTRESLEPARR